MNTNDTAALSPNARRSSEDRAVRRTAAQVIADAISSSLAELDAAETRAFIATTLAARANEGCEFSRAALAFHA